MNKSVLPIFSLLFFACGHAPQTRYFLIDVPRPKQVRAAKDTDLWLKEVRTDAVHNQDRLIYRTSPYEIHYDSYRRWALAPVEMVKQSTLDYLGRVGLFRQVAENLPNRQQPYWCLSLTIRQFEEVLTGTQRFARVALQVGVEEGLAGLSLWEGEVMAEAPIQGQDTEAIIQAMSTATEKTLQQLTAQLTKISAVPH